MAFNNASPRAESCVMYYEFRHLSRELLKIEGVRKNKVPLQNAVFLIIRDIGESD
jgi:hypothetical protein